MIVSILSLANDDYKREVIPNQKSAKNYTTELLSEGHKLNKSELKKLLQKRKEKMLDSIVENPSEFLSVVLSEKIRKNIPEELRGELEQRVTLTGSLRILASDNFEKKISKKEYFLETKDNKRYKVYPTEENPNLIPNAEIKMSGYAIADSMAINTEESGSIEVLQSPPEISAAAGISGPAVRKVAVIVVTAAGGTLTNSIADIKSAVFTGSNSSKVFHDKTFNNQMTIGGAIDPSGDVFGPYVIDTNYTGDWLVELGPRARDAAIAAGKDLTVYDNIVGVFEQTNCSSSGRAWVFPYINQSYAAVNESYRVSVAVCGNVSKYSQIYSHELGHNYGLWHANTRSCTNEQGGFVSISDTCTEQEYGDPYDTMGSGGSIYDSFQNDSLNYLGSIPDTNKQFVNATGNFTLNTIRKTTTGPQLLTVFKGYNQAGFKEYYSIEYRPGDQARGPSDPVNNGVLIRIISNHVFDSVRDDTYLLYKGQNVHPFLLNEGFNDSTRGITITPTAFTADTATVRVTITPRSDCTRVAPTVTFSSSTLNKWVNPSETYLDLGFSVRNNDDLACGASTFSLESEVPGGWNMKFTNSTPWKEISSVTLAPQTTSPELFFNLTLPFSTANGTYPIKITATNKNATNFIEGSNSFNINVAACVQTAPTLSFTPATQSTATPQTLSYTFTVKDNDNFACSMVPYHISLLQSVGFTLSVANENIGVNLSPGLTYPIPFNMTPNTGVPNGTYKVTAYVAYSNTAPKLTTSAYYVLGSSSSGTVSTLTSSSNKTRLMAVTGNKIIFTVNAKDSSGTNVTNKTIGATATNVSPRTGTGDTITSSAVTDSSGNAQFTLSTTNTALGNLTVTFSAESGTVTKSVTITAVKKGDATGDSLVNVSDFSVLMASWGTVPTNVYADLNGSGVGPVDVSDFSVVMAGWAQ